MNQTQNAYRRSPSRERQDQGLEGRISPANEQPTPVGGGDAATAASASPDESVRMLIEQSNSSSNRRATGDCPSAETDASTLILTYNNTRTDNAGIRTHMPAKTILIESV